MESLSYDEYENTNRGNYYDTSDEELIKYFRDHPHLLKCQNLKQIYINILKDIEPQRQKK